MKELGAERREVKDGEALLKRVQGVVAGEVAKDQQALTSGGRRIRISHMRRKAVRAAEGDGLFADLRAKEGPNDLPSDFAPTARETAAERPEVEAQQRLEGALRFDLQKCPEFYKLGLKYGRHVLER